MDIKQEKTISILCLTYNHEKYIRKAIDSFLSQELNFDFEIIIHDDCSTDTTVEILKEYRDQYPNLFKLILQKENQYSKGKISKIFNLLLDEAQGEFLAICEGDDYWIDTNKLQLHVDKMREFTDCDMCFHPAINLDGDTLGKVISRHANSDKIFSSREIILKEGAFCPTASLFIRKESVSNSTIWSNDLPVIDYFLQVLASLRGGALYIDIPMSVYRVSTPGGWSQSVRDVKRREVYLNSIIEGYKILDKYTKGEYKKELSYVISIKISELGVLFLQKKQFKRYRELISLAYHTNEMKDFRFYAFYYLSFFPKLLFFILYIRGINL